MSVGQSLNVVKIVLQSYVRTFHEQCTAVLPPVGLRSPTGTNKVAACWVLKSLHCWDNLPPARLCFIHLIHRWKTFIFKMFFRHFGISFKGWRRSDLWSKEQPSTDIMSELLVTVCSCHGAYWTRAPRFNSNWLKLEYVVQWCLEQLVEKKPCVCFMRL